MARQLVVEQVGDVQVDQLAAGPALQRSLHLGRVDLELAPSTADPQVAAGGSCSGSVGSSVSCSAPTWNTRIEPQALFSSRAASSAKYVSTPSAPARLNASNDSIITASWSSQPLAAAAFSIEYSPLT